MSADSIILGNGIVGILSCLMILIVLRHNGRRISRNRGDSLTVWGFSNKNGSAYYPVKLVLFEHIQKPCNPYNFKEKLLPIRELLDQSDIEHITFYRANADDDYRVNRYVMLRNVLKWHSDFEVLINVDTGIYYVKSYDLLSKLEQDESDALVYYFNFPRNFY